MSLREEYITTLRLLESTSPIRFYDNTQLTILATNSRLGSQFNICDTWDLFVPNTKKPYSILNTDDSSKSGTHWVAVYEARNRLYVYDSFARTSRLMNPFVLKMQSRGFKVIFVNRKKEQAEHQLNCGLRSLLWLIYVKKYGIQKARHI